VNSPPENGLEVALIVTDEREVWEEGRGGDKTTAAAVFISCSCSLPSLGSSCRDFHLCPGCMGLQGTNLFGLEGWRVCGMKLDSCCAENALLLTPVLATAFWSVNCKEVTAIVLSQFFPMSFLYPGKLHLNFLSALHHSKRNLTELPCRPWTFAWSSLTHRNVKRQNQHKKHLHFASKVTWPKMSLQSVCP